MRSSPFLRPTRRLLLGGLGLSLSAGSAPALAQQRAAAARSIANFQPIEIAARKLSSFSRTSTDGPEARYGRLQFRGGLVLASTSKDFGGLSGLAIEPDGRRFVAVGDAGTWLTGTLTYDGTAPSGIVDARMGPILAFGGKGLTRKRDLDAEAVALVDGDLAKGTVLIAFERNHRIGRFPIVDRVVQAPVGYLRMPADAKAMSRNKGLEAMTVLAGGPLKGSIVAISERYPEPNGQHVGWIWVRGEPKRFGLTDMGGFDITDVASLSDGSLIVLERRFRWLEGVKMQLRLIKASALVPGTIIEGEILMTSGMSNEIDNMEGLSLHSTSTGETVLTLVSDDNFNTFLQRSILLQFSLKV
jgi:hypothetical protein